jgi:2-C-methyl-D-erythritol 4-phosphate cytidylyltransferase
MFRYHVLARALAASHDTAHVTDESSAVEALQLQPQLVSGSADNIKITVPEDLQIAERILQARHRN